MKTISKLAIYANGILSQNLIKKAQNYDYIIATDIASLKLIKKGIIPELAIGDFDSVSTKDFEFIKRSAGHCSVYPAEKNWTDLELAVKEALKLKPKIIDIYGATGTRIDHLLAAVFLLEKISDSGILAKIIDRNNEILFVKNSVILSKSGTFPYLSLIPISQEVVVSVKGTKYELSDKKINRDQTIAISNRISGNRCQITVQRGKLIVVRSKD